MFLPRLFGRQDVRSTRRSRPGRRPLVEGLEGRQLLTSFNFAKVAAVVSTNPVGTNVAPKKTIETAAIQGNHIGTAAIQGNHIGFQTIPVDHNGNGMVPAGCQGCHIGYQ